MSNPRHWILSAALVLAASAGCGDAGNSQPPLPLGESNAAAIAAEVLITLELRIDPGTGASARRSGPAGRHCPR